MRSNITYCSHTFNVTFVKSDRARLDGGGEKRRKIRETFPEKPHLRKKNLAAPVPLGGNRDHFLMMFPGVSACGENQEGQRQVEQSLVDGP